MCGIFGHTKVNAERVDRSRAALHTLAHRGPDQWADWFDADVYLGHRRLSILDLSPRAGQPMVAEDSSVVLTANGEIYNFKSLRSMLAPKYSFQTGSDSEVLLHGYREWGIEGLLGRIEGMYAFALYDTRINKVFLARDRVGIKPLYYALLGGRIAWASELKAIAMYWHEIVEVDQSAIYDFLTYLYIPTPKSLYKGVFKLEPAHFLEIDAVSQEVSKRRYWQLETREIPICLDDAADGVRRLISGAVAGQLCSDVPLGFFLSGGIDSSIVVYEASRVVTGASTYCIGFEDDYRDEQVYAQQAADCFGTHHRSRTLPRSSFPLILDNLKSWYDEPFADTSAFPTHLVSEFARETCKVVLTGDGGDEVFGGYERYRHSSRYRSRRSLGYHALSSVLSDLRRNKRHSLRGRIANRIELRMLDAMELHTRMTGGLLKVDKQKFADELGIPEDYDDYWSYRRYYRPDLPSRTRLQYLDFHTYLPDDILTKVDRVSMVVSLEARVPLLATEVIEFVFSIPEPVRYHQGRKGLLKYAYRDRLPPGVLNRVKQGFSIPLQSYGNAFMRRGQSKQEAILSRLYSISATQS